MTGNSQRDALERLLSDLPDPSGRADAVLAWMRENGYVGPHAAMLRELHHFETEQAITEALALDAERSDADRMSDDVRTVLKAALTPEAERGPVVVDDAMVSRARRAINDAGAVLYSETIRAALVAALTPDGQETDR